MEISDGTTGINLSKEGKSLKTEKGYKLTIGKTFTVMKLSFLRTKQLT